MSTADLKKLASISIHAPTRGATQPPNIANTTIRFQSTLPREERRLSPSACLFRKHFNPRSHERSDDLGRLLMSLFLNFNPRSHERSDVKGFHFMLFILCNFNPRSHERSDTNTPPKYLFTTISIHAPTRGATSLCLNCGIKKEFQSTLPREERPTCCCKLSCSCHFNPRSHERSD